MKYLRPFTYPFSNSRWHWTLLTCGVALFVPIVGLMVVIGYLFGVIEGFVRRDSDAEYPAFRTDQLLTYLVRGAWPFLVQFIVNLAITMPIMAVFMVVMFGFVLRQGQPNLPLLWGIEAVYFLSLVLVQILAAPVTKGFYLRAGLMQDFYGVFSLRYLFAFIRRVGWLSMLVALIEFAAGIGVLLLSIPLGCVAGAIGLIMAFALIQMASHHYLYQLYLLYLQRGGEPIPLKEPGQEALAVESVEAPADVSSDPDGSGD